MIYSVFDWERSSIGQPVLRYYEVEREHVQLGEIVRPAGRAPGGEAVALLDMLPELPERARAIGTGSKVRGRLAR